MIVIGRNPSLSMMPHCQTYIGSRNLINENAGENYSLNMSHDTVRKLDMQSNMEHGCLGKRLKKEWRECAAHELHYSLCNT